MGKRIAIGNVEVEVASPNLPQLLKSAYNDKIRPLCLCVSPGVPMYIARVNGNEIVKRMPNTGQHHKMNCDHYEPPPEISGIGQVLGAAITEDVDSGVTNLKLDFSLKKTGTRQIANAAGEEKDSVKTDGTKLTLLSTLHYLWHRAELNKWYPAMKGKRNWYIVQRELSNALENLHAKGSPLPDQVYIPEPYRAEKKVEISQRRHLKLSKLSKAGAGKSLMILIGEYSKIDVANFGHRLVLKHLPDFPLYLNDDIYNRLKKRFGDWLQLHDDQASEDLHLIFIVTFSLNTAGSAIIEEASVMPVTANWLPFEGTDEKLLLDVLDAQQRRFTKGLRFNLSPRKPLAVAVLSDTGAKATAMYIVRDDEDGTYERDLGKLIDESALATWTWKIGTVMPDLPAICRD